MRATFKKYKAMQYQNTLPMLVVLLLMQAAGVRADARYDWESLLNTRRIAIVAPFFCTVPPPAHAQTVTPTRKPTARMMWPKTVPDASTSGSPARQSGNRVHPPTAKTAAKTTLQPAPVQIDPTLPQTKPAAAVTEADKSFHTRTLQTLTATLQTALPESIAAGRTYQVLPDGDVQAALRQLRWQSRDLFQFQGKPTQGKFPAPDLKHIQKFAQLLHVDGVLVSAMREPASVGDGLRLPYELWMVNPFDLGVRRRTAHVLSPRVQAFLITAEGKTAWQDEQAADHPRSTPRTLNTLLVDWQEATEQVAQQLADSLNRLPPG